MKTIALLLLIVFLSLCATKGFSKVLDKAESMSKVVTLSAEAIGTAGDSQSDDNLKIKVFKIKPYDINLEGLKQEFKLFKLQYAILWSLIFASLFVMVEAK